MSYRIVEVKPRRYKDYLPSETLPGILKARRYEKIFVVQKLEYVTTGMLWWKKTVCKWKYVDWHLSIECAKDIINDLKPEVVYEAY